MARGLWVSGNTSGSVGIPDISIYIDPRVRLKSAQSNHDFMVARGLWVSGNTSGPVGIPDISIYIDPRVRLKSAQSNHDFIVARGLWVSGNTSLGLWKYPTYPYT